MQFHIVRIISMIYILGLFAGCTFPFISGYHDVTYTITGSGDFSPNTMEVTLSNTKIAGNLSGGETFTGLTLPFTKTYSVYFDATNKFVAQAKNTVLSGSGSLKVSVKIEGVSDKLGSSSHSSENAGTGTITTDLEWPKDTSW